jgi:molecular chaperone HscB
MPSCPECHSSLSTPLVCLDCNTLLPQVAGQPPSPFEALGVELGWKVEGKELKKQLLRLSRAVHPDFFATADDATRERAEEASAILNSAFETLKDDFRRADWLVKILGGPSDSEERQMPQVFLMQVMEWNEVLDDARSAAQGSAEWNAVVALEQELATEREARFTAIAGHLDPLPTKGAENLAPTRQELNAVRYIDKTQSEVKQLKLQATLGPQS